MAENPALLQVRKIIIIVILGYYFLNEINAVPSLEGMARMITRTSNSLVGAVTGYFKVDILKTHLFLNFLVL